MRAILGAEVDQRVEVAEEYERLGRADEADTLRREAAVLSPYLLAPVSSPTER